MHEKEQIRDRFGRHLIRSLRSIQLRNEHVHVLHQTEQNRVIGLTRLAFNRPSSELWNVSCSLLERVAPHMEQTLLWQEWMDLLQNGLEKANQLADQAAEAQFSLLLGFGEQRLGDWKKAEGLYSRSIGLFEQQKSTIRHGMALGRLGYLKYLQGRHDEALQFADESLAQLDMNNVECHRGYFIRGVVALARGDTNEAIRWIEESLAICRDHNNMRLVAMRYRTLGWAYTKHKDIAQGRKYLEDAIQLFEEMDDASECAVAKMNLGIVFALNEQHIQALDLYAEAYPLFRQLYARLNLAMLYNNQGLSYHPLGRLDDAVRAYHASIDLHKQLGNIQQLVEVRINLGKLYQSMEQKEQVSAIVELVLGELSEFDDEAIAEQFTKELKALAQQAK